MMAAHYLFSLDVAKVAEIEILVKVVQETESGQLYPCIQVKNFYYKLEENFKTKQTTLGQERCLDHRAHTPTFYHTDGSSLLLGIGMLSQKHSLISQNFNACVT